VLSGILVYKVAMTVIEVSDAIGRQVAGHLERDILSWKLQPSTRLTEEEIGRLYGVSRSPVREAFWMLERDGLLVRQGRRVVVAPVSVQDLDEVYSCRVVLDGLAVEQAASNASVAQLEEMQALLGQMTAAAHQAQGNVYFEVNRSLWSLYRTAARNATLANLLNGIGKRALRYRSAAYANDPDLLTISVAANTVIVQAMKSGAAAEARAASEQLIRRGWRVIRQYLEKSALEPVRSAGEESKPARKMGKTGAVS
jgi:GntR family transcriptional regulator, rspAB operon transcriptional repressor